MDTSLATNKSSVDDTLFTSQDMSSASTEEKLLLSYDRFYRAIHKVTCKDVDTTSPLPSLHAFLRDLNLPKDRLKDFKSIWAKAERFGQVQKVTEKFHGYRSELARKVKRRSTTKTTESLASSEMEDGIRELLRNQNRMEQQMQFSNAMLVGMEQHREQLPSLVMELVKKTSMETKMHEESALQSMVCDNRKQIERMEQLLMNLEAKVTKWDGNNSGMKSTAPSPWPEAMHNNIVYSSSEGQATCSVRSEDQRSLSPVGSEQQALSEDSASEREAAIKRFPTPTEMMREPTSNKAASDTSPLPHHQQSFTPDASGLRQILKSEQEPGSSSIKASDILSGDQIFATNSIHSDLSARQRTSLSSTEHPSNNSVARLVVSSEKECITEDREAQNSHDRDAEKKAIRDEVFDEAFLQDVLRVQENIYTSDLGHHSSPGDVVHCDGSTANLIELPLSYSTSVVVDVKEGADDVLLGLTGVDSGLFLTSSFVELCTNEQDFINSLVSCERPEA